MKVTKKETDLIASLERIAAKNTGVYKLEIEHQPGEYLAIQVKFSDSHPLTHKRERLAAMVTVFVTNRVHPRSAAARGAARFHVMRGDNLDKVTQADFFRALTFETETAAYHADRIAKETPAPATDTQTEAITVDRNPDHRPENARGILFHPHWRAVNSRGETVRTFQTKHEAEQYAEENRAKESQKPEKAKPIKVADFRGKKTYRYGDWMIYVDRTNYSEKAGCGLRNRWSILGYYAHHEDGRTKSGIGGIRDAVKDLDALNN